jgi:hypothetical protein
MKHNLHGCEYQETEKATRAALDSDEGNPQSDWWREALATNLLQLGTDNSCHSVQQDHYGYYEMVGDIACHSHDDGLLRCENETLSIT